jgi:hypothetical protein
MAGPTPRGEGPSNERLGMESLEPCRARAVGVTDRFGDRLFPLDDCSDPSDLLLVILCRARVAGVNVATVELVLPIPTLEA